MPRWPRRPGTSLRVLTEAVGAVSLPHSGTLRLGYLRSVSTTIVAELVSSFHRAHPDVPVAQREGPSGELLDLIDADELDLAVVSPRPPAPYGWTHLGRQSLALAVPAAHKLADRPVIDLAEVASERFLALDPRFATRAQAEALTEEAGFRPDVVLQTDDLRTLREYVAEGHGVAILPGGRIARPPGAERRHQLRPRRTRGRPHLAPEPAAAVVRPRPADRSQRHQPPLPGLGRSPGRAVARGRAALCWKAALGVRCFQRDIESR